MVNRDQALPADCTKSLRSEMKVSHAKDTFDFLVVEERALLCLEHIQRVQLSVSAVGQCERAPSRQLLLSGVNIGL